jgi:phosphoribosylanthranilate isomerase
MKLKVKVCGLNHPENIRSLSQLKVNYMGFIFYSASKRHVANLQPEILEVIPPGVKKVGVFVNQTIDEVMSNYHQFGLDMVQLHGNESVKMVQSLKDKDVSVMKAFGISASFDFGQLRSYEPVVDFFLFDTFTASHGGSGRTFDWNLLQQYTLQKPYFLSGGISPDMATAIHRFSHDENRLFGVDINSRFEVRPGIKDIQLIEEFLIEINGEEHHA